MRKSIAVLLAFSAVLLMPALHSGKCTAQTQSTQIGLSNVIVEKIVLMPFMTGKLESSDQPIAKPLSKPFPLPRVENENLSQGADLVLTRIVNDDLKKRFQERLVPQAQVEDTCRAVCGDAALDTPRKRAVRLGEALEANLVMVGTVWRYREKGALAEIPDSPASVGFALYLVDVNTGVRLWRGSFDGTQKALTQDVLGGLKQLGMGVHWLSAEELARYGVKSVLKTLKLN